MQSTFSMCMLFTSIYDIFPLYFQILALLCMMCAAPAFNSTQHWFLLVVVCAFLGTIFFSLYHLCLDTYLKNVNVGWLPSVSIITSWFFAVFFLVWRVFNFSKFWSKSHKNGIILTPAYMLDSDKVKFLSFCVFPKAKA